MLIADDSGPMASYLINVFVLFCVGPFLAFGAVQGSRPRSGQLLVILLDGFRWDYLNYDAFGNDGLRRLIREGTAVEYLQPVYPSDSYPNYYSLMTGENKAMSMTLLRAHMGNLGNQFNTS